MSETIATVGVFLTEDERKHLVRLSEELEALEDSSLRNGEGPEAQTRAAERAALRKLMFLPLSGPAGHVDAVVTQYESLGNGDLTPEQLEGMEMWDCDEMLDKRHRAVGSYLVKRAVAEIRRRRATDRAALPDETRQVIATIINHKDSIGAWLEAAALRTLLARAEDAGPRASPDVVRSVVRDAIDWAHQQSLSKSFDDHLAGRLAEQLASVGPAQSSSVSDAFKAGFCVGLERGHDTAVVRAVVTDEIVRYDRASMESATAEYMQHEQGPGLSPSRQTLAEAFIAGAAWVNDNAQITDSGCGASIDMPADADIDKAADQFAMGAKTPNVAAAIRHLHETSERAPDARAVPMRLVRQDAFDALLALIGGKP